MYQQTARVDEQHAFATPFLGIALEIIPESKGSFPGVDRIEDDPSRRGNVLQLSDRGLCTGWHTLMNWSSSGRLMA